MSVFGYGDECQRGNGSYRCVCYPEHWRYYDTACHTVNCGLACGTCCGLCSTAQSGNCTAGDMAVTCPCRLPFCVLGCALGCWFDIWHTRWRVCCADARDHASAIYRGDDNEKIPDLAALHGRPIPKPDARFDLCEGICYLCTFESTLLEPRPPKRSVVAPLSADAIVPSTQEQALVSHRPTPNQGRSPPPPTMQVAPAQQAPTRAQHDKPMVPVVSRQPEVKAGNQRSRPRWSRRRWHVSRLMGFR